MIENSNKKYNAKNLDILNIMRDDDWEDRSASLSSSILNTFLQVRSRPFNICDQHQIVS